MLSNLIIAACVFISAIQPVLSEPISFPGTGLNFLSRRQDASSAIDANGIPTQCTTQCQPIVDVITNNATCANDPLPCLCTNALATTFQTCLTCVVTNDPTIQQGFVDADIASLNQACSAAGTPISVGGSSSSSSSSNGAAATQTGGGTTVGTSAGVTSSGSTTTPAPAAGAGASTRTSTGTTSAATTSTTSGAQRLSGSVVGAVFAALLAGTSFVVAV